MHRVPFPMEMAFAELLQHSPQTPILCVSASITVLCPALAASAACRCPQRSIAWTPNATSPCPQACKAVVFASCCNPHPMAPGIFEDPSCLFLQAVPLLPCRTSPCSHWSFTADVKESKPRALIVFVGGNLVIAFWILLTPSDCAGAGASLGGLRDRRRGSCWCGSSPGCKVECLASV